MSYTVSFPQSKERVSPEVILSAEASALHFIQNPLVFHSGTSRGSNFFSVQETPVLFRDAANPAHVNLYSEKKVLVNLRLNEAISIVRSGFLVVSHQEAFRLGESLFQELFGVRPQVHKERLSQNTTDYRVDLISEDCKYILNEHGFRLFTGSRDMDKMSTDRSPRVINQFDAPDRLLREWSVPAGFSDEYYPFIRVSNYLREGNSMYIELGFYRSRCSNGMLLGTRSKTIFKQSYVLSSFEELKRRAFDFFSERENYLHDSMHRMWKLLSMGVSREQMRLIPFAIFEDVLLRKSVEERKRLQHVITDLVSGYTQEIGENMNAALNVATDFSKHLGADRMSTNHLQRMCSQWMHRVTARNFNTEKYMNSLEGIEDRILNAAETWDEVEMEEL